MRSQLGSWIRLICLTCWDLTLEDPLKARLLAVATSCATVALAVVIEQNGCAADQSAALSNATQSGPKVEFLRPLTNEVFSNAPIYVQVRVDNFKLVAPDHNDQTTEPSGYIRYTLDDFPVVCTKATQIMVNKNLGRGYIPAGKHYLRAELVDSSDHPLGPPVIANIQFWSAHPAYIEATRAGVGASPTKQDQLRSVQRDLQKVQTQLLQLESGDTGYKPKPMIPRPSKTGK